MKTELARTAKTLRWRYRRLRARMLYSQAALSRSPVFLGISFPKSGTHLLTQVLTAFTQIGPAVESGLPAILTFEGATGKPRSEQTILRELLRLQPGDIAYGHLHATAETAHLVTGGGFAPYFIYRDPRDVVVSHVHYVTEMAPNHVHHAFYKNVLHTFNERLVTSITGRPELQIPFPDIRERFLPYLGWLDQPQVMPLKFEDFIYRQQETIGQIFDHAVANGFQPSMERDKAIHVLQTAINPKQSPTYRSGVPGKWRSSFTAEHKEIFKEVAGDLLIQLGYEENNDW